MNLTVLPNSPIPAYRQLYDQIAFGVLSGELAPNTALPSIRTVAKELGISVITVRSAWEALTEDGYIESKAGSGCFIAPLDQETIGKLKADALKAPLSELVRTAESLKLTKIELIEIIEKSIAVPE